MKKNKIALSLVAASLSVTVFAGTAGDPVKAPSGISLIAPDSVAVWSLGLEAMYVEPTNNEFIYGQNVNISNTTNNITSYKNSVVNNDWEWAGIVDLTYMFPGNSSDVKLAWTHLFSTTSSDSTSPGTYQFFQTAFSRSVFGPTFIGTINDSGYELTSSTGTITGSLSTDYNAVDLVFGQLLKLGDHLDLHPSGGLRWGEVKSNFNIRGNVVNDAVGVDVPVLGNTSSILEVFHEQITSDFNGIGPRAGIDTAVHFNSGFSIVGNVAGSLLVGRINSKFISNDAVYTTIIAGATTTTTADPFPNNGKNNHDNTRVVPELDARLGLNYRHNFSPSTTMNIQLGYQVVNYFHVTEADFISSGLGYYGGSFVNTTSNREDWGYQGPYLRVQLNLA